MVKKDTGLSIPVLEMEDYFHWKGKMHLHLLSQDTSYVQCIEKGPHVPMKIVTGVNVDGTMELDKFFPKLLLSSLKKMRRRYTNTRRP